MASQITRLSVVYSTVYLGADQRKHQSSAPLAFVWGIHRGPVNSPPKGPATLKMFPFDDVIMICTWLCCDLFCCCCIIDTYRIPAMYLLVFFGSCVAGTGGFKFKCFIPQKIHKHFMGISCYIFPVSNEVASREADLIKLLATYFFPHWPFRPKGYCRFLCVRLSARKLYLACMITRHRFGLESPNLHQICIMRYPQLVLKKGIIDLDLQSHFGHFDSEF